MNSPFEDWTKFQKKKLFDLLEAHFYKFTRNQEVLPTIKNENIICIIMEGSAQISNIEYNGNEIIMEELIKDSVFGSNISLTNSDEHQILAKEDTEVLVIDYIKLINSKNITHNYYNIFLKNLFEIINIKFKFFGFVEQIAANSRFNPSSPYFWVGEGLFVSHAIGHNSEQGVVEHL